MSSEELADKTIICYRQPVAGKTLDEWPMAVELIPVEDNSFNADTIIGEIDIVPVTTVAGEPLTLLISQGPNGAITVNAELWEPLSGWKEVIKKWALTLN